MLSSTNRLECLGKSSISSKKQSSVDLTSAHAETHKPSDSLGKNTVTDKLRRSLPAHSLPRSVQEAPKPGSSSEDMLNTEDWYICSPKESGSIIPRVEEQAELIAVPGEEVEIKAQPSAVTGKTLVSPPFESLPINEANEKEEQTEEEDAEDEDLKAPVELIMEFLRVMMDRDFELARKLCQMILIYEPDNPEASEFLPLIQKKLLEEEEVEESTEDDEEDDDEDNDDSADDDSDDDGSDNESPQSSSGSSSSSSSSSPSDDDEEDKKQVNRHKLCPPSQVSP